MPQLGPLELGLILLVVVFIFGVGKLPELGGLFNKGIREFRKSQAELDEQARSVQARKEATEGAE
jgi:sec-independent protein translocase protein TatA